MTSAPSARERALFIIKLQEIGHERPLWRALVPPAQSALCRRHHDATTSCTRKHSPGVGLTLGQRLRRWTNDSPTPVHCIVRRCYFLSSILILFDALNTRLSISFPVTDARKSSSPCGYVGELNGAWCVFDEIPKPFVILKVYWGCIVWLIFNLDDTIFWNKFCF